MIHILEFEVRQTVVFGPLDRQDVTFFCQVRSLTPSVRPQDNVRQTIAEVFRACINAAPKTDRGIPNLGSHIAVMTGTEPGTESVNGVPIPPTTVAALFWHAQMLPHVPSLLAVRVTHGSETAEYTELPDPTPVQPPAAPKPRTQTEEVQARLDAAVKQIDRLIKRGLPKPGGCSSAQCP